MKRLLGLMVLCSFGAQAQTWAKEPAAVLGMKLGAPVDESVVPRCVGDRFASQRVCLEYYQGRPSAMIGGFPFPFAAGTVHFDAGVVSKIEFRLKSESFQRMRDILVERYGSPTSSEVSRVTTGAGAVLGAETALWTGKSMSITAVERFISANDAIVIFSDNAITNRQFEKRRGEIKSGADKL